MKKVSITLVTSLLLILVVSLPLLLFTENGLQLMYRIAVNVAPGKLEITGLTGSLVNHVKFKQLYFKQDDTELTIKNGKLSWQGKKLMKGTFYIDRLYTNEINLKIPKSDNQDSKDKFTLPKFSFPIGIVIANAIFEKIVIINGDSAPEVISKFNIQNASIKNVLNISQLDAQWKAYHVSLNGELNPTAQIPIRVSARLIIQDLMNQPFTLDSTFSGGLNQLKTTAKVTGFVHGEVNGNLFNVASELSWKANANVNKLSLDQFSNDLPNNNIEGNFSSEGTLGNIQFVGKATSDYPAFGKLALQYDLTLLEKQVVFKQLTLTEINKPATLEGKGDISWAEENIRYNLDVDWQQMNWPWLTEPVANSEAGKLSFVGTLTNYALNLQGDLMIKEYPKIRLNTKATGSDTQLNFTQLQINGLSGTANGSATLNWKDAVSWKTKVDLLNIDAREINEYLPENISLHVISNGKLEKDDFHLKTNLSKIRGALHGKPFSGTANIGLLNNDIDIETLSFNVADATFIDISGKIADQLYLAYDIRSSDLSTLYPEFGGKVSAKGALSGSMKNPSLALDVDSQQLKYGEVQLEKLHGAVQVVIQENQTSNIELAFQKIKYEDTLIGDFSINLHGTAAEHRLSLTLTQPLVSANWNIKGEFENNIWNASLTDSEINSHRLGTYQLKNKSKLVISKNSFHVEQNCYIQEQSTFCFDGTHNSVNLITNLSWGEFPTKSLQWLLPENITIDSKLNGFVNLLQEKENLIVSAGVTNTAGQAKFTVDDEEHRLLVQAGSAYLVKNPKLLDLSVQLPFENNAKVYANAFILTDKLDLTLLQQPLKSDIHIALPSLIMLSPFITDIKNLENAQLHSVFNITGSVSEPNIVGLGEITSEQILVPQLNLKLNKIKVKAQSNKKNQIEITGSVKSGSGDLKISGLISQEKDKTWQNTLNINGDQFQVINIPEASVEISPTLNIKFQYPNLLAEGEILIPFARLRPSVIPVTAERESSDTVIVSEEVSSKVSDKKNNWNFNSKIRVVLGDRVNFEGFGLRSALSGSMLIIDESEKVTTGQGEINLVNAHYRAFGQELKVTKGRFIFANTPVDDPTLDFVAQRQIEDIVVGMNVTSHLQSPEIRLFSQPTMAESDSLSYLLLGRPIIEINKREGSGLMAAATALGMVGSEILAKSIGNRLGIDEILIETSEDSQNSSLVIGSYLSPNLYLRYLTGIVERSNIVQLRYNLSKKVILQTETGSQTGADVFYSIEH